MYSRNSSPIFASSIANIAGVLLQKFASQKPEYSEVFLNWKAAVGESFASISAPYKVLTHNNNKVLVIKSKKGRSIELLHCSQEILRRIHNFLGKQIFSSVKIIQIDQNDNRL